MKAAARQPAVGKVIDDAMLVIERDNPSLKGVLPKDYAPASVCRCRAPGCPSLKGVLPKDYAHPRLDKQRLGQLIDLVGNIALGDQVNRSKDILGRVYEYFLSQFASAEGAKLDAAIAANLAHIGYHLIEEGHHDR